MSFDFKKLKKGDHIHLTGICGTAMGSLAGILKGMGFHITGSDQNVYPPMSTQLAELGIEIKKGYKKENLEPKPDLVIVGNVISRHFEEAEALLASDIPYTSLPKALGEFVIDQRKSIVVSGTHGKTTTTSMMAWVADQLGEKPGFLIGGIPKNFSRSFAIPEANTFVIEGDEYDTAFFDKVPKFVHYKPQYVIFTSLEFDHADIYDSLDDIKAAFEKLIELIPERGVLVANADNEDIVQLSKACRGQILTYGLRNGEFQARNLEENELGVVFDVYRAEEKVETLQLSVFGEYNVMNALAAYALSTAMEWPRDKVKEALASFGGVKRRQEIIGRPNGITIIDDFAHHPTAVKMTIEAVQKRYKGRNVFSVFEPRSATSRRAIFQDDYADAFSQAQKLLLAKPYDQKKIAEDERFSSEKLVSDLKVRNVEVDIYESAEEIVSHLKAQAKPEDIILIMSNGGFDGLYDKLLEALG